MNDACPIDSIVHVGDVWLVATNAYLGLPDALSLFESSGELTCSRIQWHIRCGCCGICMSRSDVNRLVANRIGEYLVDIFVAPTGVFVDYDFSCDTFLGEGGNQILVQKFL